MESPPEPPRPAVTIEPVPTADDTQPSSVTTAHLARFEFSDLGTKVLMVEWHPGAPTSSADAIANGDPTPSSDLTPPSDDLAPNTSSHADDNTRSTSGNVNRPAPDFTAWQVSWAGKSTYLPARDTDEDEAGPRRRVYFFLPPESPVPANVTITRPGRPSLLVKPLPAIFPAGFDVESGARGVLHTLWAKRRLCELEREMDAEMRANAESVGLEMALAEKQWIVDNFLRPQPSSLPMSPKSPIPGRLGEKLKGLRLATSPADLSPSSTGKSISFNHVRTPQLIGD